MIALKEDLFKAINKHCKERCPRRMSSPESCYSQSCSLFPYRSIFVARQTDIFRVTDIDVFMSRVLEVATSYGPEPFYWSQLRSDVNLRPLHDNWWGVSTRMLKKNGFKVIDGTRRSTHKSRCGAFDRQWKKS